MDTKRAISTAISLISPNPVTAGNVSIVDLWKAVKKRAGVEGWDVCALREFSAEMRRAGYAIEKSPRAAEGGIIGYLMKGKK